MVAFRSNRSSRLLAANQSGALPVDRRGAFLPHPEVHWKESLGVWYTPVDRQIESSRLLEMASLLASFRWSRTIRN